MQRDLLQRQQRQNLGTGIFDVGEYIVDGIHAIADRVEYSDSDSISRVLYFRSLARIARIAHAAVDSNYHSNSTSRTIEHTNSTSFDG